jgi:zinc/manganese transport system permease protein
VLEPKPGVEPSASHLQSVLAALKATPAKMVVYAAYQDPKPSEWLGRNAGVGVVKVPFTVGGSDAARGPVRTVRRHRRAPARRRHEAVSWNSLDWGILGPALVAGLLVLATHVPLGMQVLDRGIVFIDLAIAQIAGLGVIAADAIGLPEGGVAVQAAAVSAALLGAWLLTWTERRAPQQQEALIGVLFILAACAGLLLLARQSARRRAPQGPARRPDPLGHTRRSCLARRVFRCCCSRRSLPAGSQRLGRFGFYGAFALAVTASVQLVGVYLVFSSLIIPALATSADARRRKLWVAYAIGAVGYALGLALSALFDLPSGAVIVWTLAACGLAWKGLGLARRRRRIRSDDAVRPTS